MKLLKRNPSKNGFLCEMFTYDTQGLRDYVGKVVVIAKTRDEATAIMNKSLNYDPKIKYMLDYIMIFS